MTHFTALLQAFQQACALLQAGQARQARTLIVGLPEPVYELALDWYDNEHKNYYYYLVRFVLDSMEKESRYCRKERLKANIALYREMVNSLEQPQAVHVKGELVVLNQLELF